MPEPRKNQTSADRSEIEAALHRLSEGVDVPSQPSYAPIVQHRLDSLALPRRAKEGPQSARRLVTLHPFAVTGVVLLVLLAVTFSLPAGRQAVADLFDITGVRVLPLPPTTSAPRATVDPRLDLGEPVTLAEAQRRLSFPIAVPAKAGLGPPDRVYVQRGSGIESVTLVYRPGAGLPEVLDSQVGLLLSEYAGSATPYFNKYVDEKQPPTQVTVARRWPGLYFPGPQQVLIRDSAGVVHNEHPRLSAPSLVWVQGVVTYRLEASINQEQALAVAASVH